MIFPLQVSFTMLVSGPSSSGKSFFTCKLLNNLDKMTDKKIERVQWFFAEENSVKTVKKCLSREALQKTKFIHNLPDEFENIDGKNMLIVIDDLMSEAQNQKIADLFTRSSHHKNQSVILITQNIFHQSKYARDISLNAKYICVFRSPRDLNQIRYLSRQISDSGDKVFQIYKELTNDTPHSYLFIDLTQNTPSILRFRSDIFSDISEVFCVPNTSRIVSHETYQNEPIYSMCIEKC